MSMTLVLQQISDSKMLRQQDAHTAKCRQFSAKNADNILRQQNADSILRQQNADNILSQQNADNILSQQNADNKSYKMQKN